MKRFWCAIVMICSVFSSIANAESFDMVGDFENCNSSDDGQRREALISLQQRAHARCSHAVQTSDVFFEEASECMRYRRGQLASASFTCVHDGAEVIKRFQISATIANNDCDEFINEYGNYVDLYHKLTLKIRDEAVKQCSGATPEIQSDSVTYRCKTSVLRGTARYSCLQ